MFWKFLLTVAVIAFVWFGLRALRRAGEGRRAPPPPSPRQDGAAAAQELVQCRVCGTWRLAKSCGRQDCPF